MEPPQMESAPSNKHEQQDSFFTAELVDKTKDALSKQLHTEWRDGIRTGFEANDQSPDTPRLRASKDSTGEADAEWFAEQEAAGVEFPTDDKGNKLINTNVAYEDLPPSWKNANIGAANFVVDNIVEDSKTGKDVVNDDYIEGLSSRIHDQWMEDNSWQKDQTPELFVPYDDLPESEKAKDRDHVLLALDALTSPEA